MAVVRRLANALLRRDTRSRMGINAPRLKTGRNLAYKEKFFSLCNALAVTLHTGATPWKSLWLYPDTWESTYGPS